jgi:hypothetical protein
VEQRAVELFTRPGVDPSWKFLPSAELRARLDAPRPQKMDQDNLDNQNTAIAANRNLEVNSVFNLALCLRVSLQPHRWRAVNFIRKV